MNVPRTSLPMSKSKSNDASEQPVEEVVETIGFRDLGLAAPLMKALDEVGYETPSPIQAKADSNPHLLEGKNWMYWAKRRPAPVRRRHLRCPYCGVKWI